ncbi:MAG TPA: family 20 glycosylhydrolase [Terracidiphilus sp.]|nr:family 20 glycosylhydrolase [Terracidiphilus sp.]
MRKKNATRREFLLSGGATLTSVIASSPLLASAAFSDSSVDAGLRGADPIAGPKRLRGLMIDAARVPEELEYYKRVIEFCADWEFNALHFRLADDQGSAMRFASVPGLLLHPHAFAPEELKDLVTFAQKHGVDLIPELEAFGHTGYITRSPQFAHLLDDEPSGSSEFTGVIPVASETLELFKKLFGEVASVFPSVYLHGGCDEVNWGGSELSRKALTKKDRAQIWAEYLNSLNQVAVGLGKQFIVWGDFVLHKEPKILPQLNKNILIMDWNYRDTDTAKIQQTLALIQTNGSRGIGAPGLISYRWGPRPGTEQLGNIGAFADVYLAAENPGSLGAILTNWVPSRYLQNSIWDGFAYAAVAFTQGSAIAADMAFRRFVEKHYGAEWNDLWKEAFHLTYDAAPQVKGWETASGSPPLRAPWSSDEEFAAVLKDRTPRKVPFAQIRNLLERLKPTVRRNQADFEAFALSAQYLEQVFWRDESAIECSNRNPLTEDDAGKVARSIADRDHAMAEALTRDWDRGRFADSPAKSSPLFGFQPKDQLLFRWGQAASYSASLATNPRRFYQLVKSSA